MRFCNSRRRAVWAGEAGSRPVGTRPAESGNSAESGLLVVPPKTPNPKP